MISGGNKSKLISLNLAMIPNLELLLRMKKSKVVNIKVKTSSNIHLILKFFVGLKYVTAVSSAVLGALGQSFYHENLDGRGVQEPCLPWGWG